MTMAQSKASGARTRISIQFGRVLALVALLVGSLAPSNAIQTTNLTIVALQKEAALRLAALQHGDDDDDDIDTDEPLEDVLDPPAEPVEIAGSAPEVTPSSIANINDEDAKCYASRYQDIDAALDPKAHFSTVGVQQGRLGTCAKRLSDYEARRYLEQNPLLQRLYGRTGPSSLRQAREHWQTVGYKDSALAATVVDPENEPWQCAKAPSGSCLCPGVMWFGLAVRPDNEANIETFDEFREWRTIQAEKDGWQTCSVAEFGQDPAPGQPKQCWCELKPRYTPSRCADEGDDCLCNGHVYLTSRLKDDGSPASFFDAMEGEWAIADANNSGSMECTSASFDGADPAPKKAKQCYCDDKREYTTVEMAKTVMEMHSEEAAISATEAEVLASVAGGHHHHHEDEDEDEDHEKEEGEGKHHGDEDDDDDDEDHEEGHDEEHEEEEHEHDEMEHEAHGCGVCKHLHRKKAVAIKRKEVEKQRMALAKRFRRLRRANQRKKQVANNKNVESQNFCAQAQRDRDPIQKKKDKTSCHDLGVEAAKIKTEAEIEYQSILEQEKLELQQYHEREHRGEEEERKADEEDERKLMSQAAKFKEEQTERVAKETEERLNIVKKKLEKEKIHQGATMKQSSAMEKQVTTIQKQIEEVEKQLTKELKDESNTADLNDSEGDESSQEAEQEIVSEVTSQQNDIKAKVSKASSKKESLISRTQELEVVITEKSKILIETKAKVESGKAAKRALQKKKQELKAALKGLGTQETTKLETEIDDINEQIHEKEKEIKRASAERETAVAEETTARTEMTYASQSIKKIETFEQHASEQLIITEVVIKSKQAKLQEETEKKTIAGKQINCFKKWQEYNSMKEKVKQLNVNRNNKLSRKKKALEELSMAMKESQGQLQDAEDQKKALEAKLAEQKTDAGKASTQAKLEGVTSRVENIMKKIEKQKTRIANIKSKIASLEEGNDSKAQEAQLKQLEADVEAMMKEATRAMSDLPLVKAETVDGKLTASTITTSSGPGRCGVVGGLTITGTVGDSTTSTSSTGDISVTITEKQETAAKVREQATKTKEYAESEVEEFEEEIEENNEKIEEAVQLINDTKKQVTEMKQKRQEILTKMSSTQDSGEIESYKAELISVTTTITESKKIIRTSTETKIRYEESSGEARSKVIDLKNKVDTAEKEAQQAEEEAISTIEDGIEATYIVEKRHVQQRNQNEAKTKENEYKEKKIEYEQKITKNQKELTAKKQKLAAAESEVASLNQRLSSEQSRLGSAKENEKKAIQAEITSIQTEITRYTKIITEYTVTIRTLQTYITTITTSWQSYVTTYTTIKVEAANSEADAKETEQYSVTRRRRRAQRHQHRRHAVDTKRTAAMHRHAYEGTRKKTNQQKRQLQRQRHRHRKEVAQHVVNIQKYRKEVSESTLTIEKLKLKRAKITKESDKKAVDDEIANIEAKVETYRTDMKVEETQKNKVEEEQIVVSAKITSINEQVAKLKKETEKIEEEAAKEDNDLSAGPSKKAADEVKRRQKRQANKRKSALKKKIRRLAKIQEERERRIEKNNRKLVQQTRKIAKDTQKTERITKISRGKQEAQRYASCQRLILDGPGRFDLSSLCGANAGDSLLAVGAMLNSQQCQQCYQQNPSCLGNGVAAGLAAVAFSVDSMGDADDVVKYLQDKYLIADVNMQSADTSRKFSDNGRVTDDSATVRVEVVTTVSKAQSVVSHVSSWKSRASKSLSGDANDSIIAPLSGATGEYVAFVLKHTGQLGATTPASTQGALLAAQTMGASLAQGARSPEIYVDYVDFY